jgi:Ni/Co efflux regulator RcnB
MKRLILTAAASLMLAGALAAPAMAAPPAYDRHQNWREDDRNARWDDSKYNGYWVGKSWHAGAPPTSAYRKQDFRLGWRPWHRGDHLGVYTTRYVEVDWHARHLKAPPRGYHYVQTDTGDILLAALAGGVIASIIAGH